jgi:hypothetical protein
MESNHTNMPDLFAQLGLSNDQESIEKFILENGGLARSIHIENAPFWSEPQAEFIKNALAEDAEWAELIDQLNALLR